MRRVLLAVFVIIISLLLRFPHIFPIPVAVFAQQPTGSVPTVTGTPEGPMIRVNNTEGHVNVRSGPGTNFDIIGDLPQGATAPAIGRSAGGDWIQITYYVTGNVGWVYAPLVDITPGATLPIIAPPPTKTPETTPTIDPTLAAKFNIPLTATRLPTFTPAVPIQVPTFTPAPAGVAGLPMGLIITILAFIGIFGAIVSFLRGR